MLESGYLHKFALDSRVVCIELFCQRVDCLIYTFHGLVVGKKHTWRFKLVPLWCNCTLHLLMRAPQCCHGWRCAFCLGGRSIGIISSLENINFTMPCSYTNFQIGSINLLVSHSSHNYVGGHFVFFYRRTMMLILRFKWVVRMDQAELAACLERDGFKSVQDAVGADHHSWPLSKAGNLYRNFVSDLRLLLEIGCLLSHLNSFYTRRPTAGIFLLLYLQLGIGLCRKIVGCS